jgi:hypothetical protein
MTTRDPDRKLTLVQLDGRAFFSLAGFLEHFGERARPDTEYPMGLREVLDFVEEGLPDGHGPLVIEWCHAAISRHRLDRERLVELFADRLEPFRPTCEEEAIEGEESLFDWLVRQIRHRGLAREGGGVRAELRLG